MEKDYILTQEGKAKLEEELHYLETEKRAEIGERIRVAREFGDISENSEYDDAKNGSTEANSLEGKISNESPVGAALLGTKKGDEIDLQGPTGRDIHIKVLKIEQ